MTYYTIHYPVGFTTHVVSLGVKFYRHPILNAKMSESKTGLTFLCLGSDVPPRLSGAEVRETEICVSHVRASLLHHLLFGPTLSGEERRAGEAGKR